MKTDYLIRNVRSNDTPIIQSLAIKCSPLELHTEYTYWVCTHLFQCSSFILELDKYPIGYIMAIENTSTVFIWQIGITSEHRGKGLSKHLIGACVNYAKSVKKNLEVTISENNEESYRAFRNYCRRNGLVFSCLGDAEILDADGVLFELEKLYSIHI